MVNPVVPAKSLQVPPRAPRESASHNPGGKRNLTSRTSDPDPHRFRGDPAAADRSLRRQGTIWGEGAVSPTDQKITSVRLGERDRATHLFRRKHDARGIVGTGYAHQPRPRSDLRGELLEVEPEVRLELQVDEA